MPNHPLRALTPLAAGLSLLLSGCGHLAPSRAAAVATSYASLQLCGAVFISGADPDSYFRAAVGPRGGPLTPWLRYAVDRERGEVHTSLAGLAPSRASFRGPLGCVVSTDALPATVALPPLSPTVPALPPIAGPAPVAADDPALAAALARAFEEPQAPPLRHTQAVVVLRHGRIIGERYADGVDVDTPLLGWSATKSVTQALIGILAYQGRLDPHTAAPVAAWQAPGDPRGAITVDQLLRMTSGLDLGNSLAASLWTAFDRSAQITFLEPDMAAVAERAPLEHPPGTHWQYADGNYVLLGRMVRDLAGGDAASVHAFMHRALFDKLGMTQVHFEFDAAGTPVASSRLWASARDWARFGELYLNDGVAGHERLLPAGWVSDAAALTPGSEYAGYGAGFWTNRADTGGARKRTDAGMPGDAFMARGNDGQYVIVLPSQDAVVVRLGHALDPTGDIAGVERLVTDVIASFGESARAGDVDQARPAAR